MSNICTLAKADVGSHVKLMMDGCGAHDLPDQLFQELFSLQYLSSMPLGALRTSQYVRVVPKLCSSKLHSSWDDQVGLPIASISCYNTVSVAHQIQGAQAALPW